MARGHHYHVRVVINGHYAYNRGGDECRRILRDIDWSGEFGRTYNPLDTEDYQESFGLHYDNGDGTSTNVSYSKITSIRLIVVARTRTGKRRIKMVREYRYSEGILSHYLTTPGPDKLFDKDDEYYRTTINTVPVWNIMKEDNDNGET